MTTGERIRARRKQLGLSVGELAAKVGKNRATIYRYESDAIEMPANMLQPLADALDTSPDELMDWNLVLNEVAEHDKRMDEVVPFIQDGVSTGGSTYRYLLFKTLTHGGKLEYDFQSLLTLLYRINAADCDKEMHTIRILAELASSLDRRSLEHLVSYGEYLVRQFQAKSGEAFERPYQREQSAPVQLE